LAGGRTSLSVTGLPADGTWTLVRPDGTVEPVDVAGGWASFDLTVDGAHQELRPT
jgi:hypothetical protein